MTPLEIHLLWRAAKDAGDDERVNQALALADINAKSNKPPKSVGKEKTRG